MSLGTQRAACDVAHVERLGADLRRGGRRHGRGVAGAAGLIVDRERRKLRRNYAKLSQPKPMQAGAARALQLLDVISELLIKCPSGLVGRFLSGSLTMGSFSRVSIQLNSKVVQHGATPRYTTE